MDRHGLRPRDDEGVRPRDDEEVRPRGDEEVRPRGDESGAITIETRTLNKVQPNYAANAS